MSIDDQGLSPEQQRELDAFEAAFNGHPVDAGFNDLAMLATALESAKPDIDPGFAADLDRRVADHFPAVWVSTKPDRRPLMDRLRARFANHRRSLLVPVTAGLAGVLIVGTFVATGLNDMDSGTSSNSSSQNPSILDDTASGSDTAASSSRGTSAPDPVAPGSSSASAASGGVSPDSIARPNGQTFDQAGTSLKAFEDSGAENTSGSDGHFPRVRPAGKYAAGVNKRAVAHRTEIVLGTNAAGVQDVSNQISSVVDNHNGIVLDSNVEDGPEGVAGASFRLLIPTAQLESAVGDLSQVADLRSRTQQATDITAPTLTVEDKLATAHAEAQGLVKELSEATTDEDRASINSELADQRAKVARLTTKSNRLSRRASLTPVRVDVQTGEQFGHSEDGKWGPGDAIDDIGGFLGTAAGVALIALAVAIPIALLTLLIALVNRAWVRTSRRRILGSDRS